MPIRKVQGGYKWGSSGKVYPTRAGAEKQAQAAYANGYKGDQGQGARELADAIKNFEPKEPK